MLFALYCLDKPDHGAVRQANRPAHLTYAREWEPKMLFGGPLLDASGESMIGSLMVFDVADRAEVEAFSAGDPYTKAGLFESVTISPYRLLLGPHARI
ncbi:YciI family protein [Pararhodospirillum oryzae]|uniref:YCII-related domain-containing protein n=1 Tax=Pararhodospirillum oryzae TaxID=478448 RepID=A0A512HAQ6_9PROT|nr:YciI family protein [Pararhodospirillum oryzae]GEO82522.1 hypothetical protein ROR02_26530 [Pararhodospirillum oryzae]